MKDKIISLGDKWYEAPREYWGSRDLAKARRRYETNQPLHPELAFTPTETLPTGFGGLYEKPQRKSGSRDADRSREADAALAAWGIR